MSYRNIDKLSIKKVTQLYLSNPDFVNHRSFKSCVGEGLLGNHCLYKSDLPRWAGEHREALMRAAMYIPIVFKAPLLYL